MVRIPDCIAKRLESKAEGMDSSVYELVVDKVLELLEPYERAEGYIDSSLELINEALHELEKGDLRRASELIWHACALAIRAYANHRDGRKLGSRDDLWNYIETIKRDLGNWAYDAWLSGLSMKMNFDDGWASKSQVEDAFNQVKKLVEEISRVIKGSNAKKY